MTGVYVAGWGMTSFGRHSDTPLAELGRQAARAALEDAGVDYDDVGELFASSSLAPPQTGLQVAHGLGHTGIPVTAVESASAGGLVAFRHAVEAVRAGRCAVALAVGYEKTTALEPGGVVPKPRAFWDRCPPQVHYAVEATRWLHDRGCGPEVIAAVAAKDFNCANRNPRAARRQDNDVTAEEVLASRPVATPLTRMMCHTNADGAAAVVVTSDASSGNVEVRAVEQSSRFEDPTWPAEGPVVGPPSQISLTAGRVFERSDLSPRDVDVVSLHDMCASEELTALEAMGLCTAEEAVELAQTGGLDVGGRLPTNVDGGCIARGHAFGATGLAQAGEIVAQLRGDAGDRQVAGAQIGVVEAVGGGGSCVVAILSR